MEDQRHVCVLLSIPLDRTMGLVDPDMALLDKVYSCKVLLHLAQRCDCPLSLLGTIDIEDIGMKNAAFFRDCLDWMVRIDNDMAGNVPQVDKGAAVCLVLECFLYATGEFVIKEREDEMEDASADAERHRSFLRSPIFVEALHSICSLKDKPPVAVMGVLNLILLEIWRALMEPEGGSIRFCTDAKRGCLKGCVGSSTRDSRK